ncbi:hypothetical protein [Myceligenerans xiligouense]|uniref:hypothetical protein n=1 Tax=Myceligenerans xiligouense TaxID=253184 RepID=UPI000F4F463C|nr:hypothetical protein [Myceligenerans xiligouense]
MVVLKLSDEWWSRDGSDPHADDNFAAVLHEIELELSPDHELAGQIMRVEARFGPSDDVIVSLIDGTFALVHPTWTGRVERPPWPETTRLGDAVAASEAVAMWEQWR